MKHSNPVKFPVRFMLVSLSLSLAIVLLTVCYIFCANKSSQNIVNLNSGSTIVEQINLTSFNQALDNISN